MINLNEIKVPTDGDDISPDGKQNDFSLIDENENIEVYFKNIEYQIINKIKKYDSVIGCIAWLTNKNILKALSKKKLVSIIVQEEDFLRPDINFNGIKQKFKNKMFKLYEKINKKNYISLCNCGISYCSNGELECGIRRMGMINENKVPAFPRMHNKFIICFNSDGDRFDTCEKLNGEVLTGSYNYTENSNNSLENVVCIKSDKIVEKYYYQYAEIALLSVPLDWDSEWEPDVSELRYGS